MRYFSIPLVSVSQQILSLDELTKILSLGDLTKIFPANGEPKRPSISHHTSNFPTLIYATTKEQKIEKI